MSVYVRPSVYISPRLTRFTHTRDTNSEYVFNNNIMKSDDGLERNVTLFCIVLHTVCVCVCELSTTTWTFFNVFIC